jgi:hypothetical protein
MTGIFEDDIILSHLLSNIEYEVQVSNTTNAG